MVSRNKSYHALNISYLFQGQTNFKSWRAGHVHIYFTIRGLIQRDHKASFMGLFGRRVIITEDLETLINGEFAEAHFGDLGLSGARYFKLIESGIRRFQSEVRLPYLGLFDSFRIFDAYQKKLNEFDIIHERHNLLALGGAYASRILGIPLVLEVNADLFEQYEYQGIPETGLRKQFGLWATKLCYATARKIIAVSPEQRNHLIRKWNIDERKIAVLPCAADTAAFGKEYDTRLIKRHLGLENEPIVVWIGGFYAWHNLEYLINCFARVVNKVPKTKLLLIGNGRTKSKINQKINESALQKNVIMPGSIPHNEIPRLLSIADIAVAPSSQMFFGHGGTPLKVFEYMAAGKAIVANSISQNASVIRHEYSGLLVEPNDVNSFANSILRLLSDPNLRERLGKNARKQAVENHSWEKYSELLEYIYFSIL